MSAEQHVLLHILPDETMEGGWNLHILKIVIISAVQGVLAQASYLPSTYQTKGLVSHPGLRNLKVRGGRNNKPGGRAKRKRAAGE